jgi:hypothetical protein
LIRPFQIAAIDTPLLYDIFIIIIAFSTVDYAFIDSFRWTLADTIFHFSLIHYFIDIAADISSWLLKIRHSYWSRHSSPGER